MLTLEQVKTHLRIEIADDDDYITSLISVGYAYAENYINQNIIESEEVLTLDCFPDEIILPVSPVLSVTSIFYSDTESNSTELTDYTLDLRKSKARIIPNEDEDFPESNGNIENIVITYRAGFASISAVINHAVLLIIGALYEQREDSVVGIGVSISKIPLSSECLLNPYRVINP